MILHCTKKLYAKLPEQAKTNEPRGPAIGIQAQWLNWHANLLTVQRRQCVIAVHDATRFALFIPCLTKKDLHSIWCYTRSEWNEKQTDIYLKQLNDRFEWLSDKPFAYQ